MDHDCYGYFYNNNRAHPPLPPFHFLSDCHVICRIVVVVSVNTLNLARYHWFTVILHIAVVVPNNNMLQFQIVQKPTQSKSIFSDLQPIVYMSFYFLDFFQKEGLLVEIVKKVEPQDWPGHFHFKCTLNLLEGMCHFLHWCKGIIQIYFLQNAVPK